MPNMSASASWLRVCVFMIGVSTKKKIDTSSITSGSTAGSLTPRMPHFVPQRLRHQSSDHFRNANAGTMTSMNKLSICNVVEDVMAHLVAHYGLDLLQRAAAQQVVVQVMRMVVPNPLTLALMRVVCFEASISHTSWRECRWPAPFDSTGTVTLRIVEARHLIEDGHMNTGTIMMENTMKHQLTTAPQIHHVRGSLRTTANSATTTRPPKQTPSQAL